MANRNEYFTIKTLQSSLIAQRVKQAKRQHDMEILAGYGPNKSQLVKSNRGTIIDIRFSEDIRIFKKTMPSRRTWVHLSEKHRYQGPDKLRLTSINQNKKALELTLLRDKEQALPYMQLQEQVLKGLRKQIFKCKYEFSHPKINKAFKNKSELRPVCSFPIFDNIVLKECNRVLSTWFDPLFCDSSYAFRMKGKGGKSPTHHDTIYKILNYIQSNNGQQIYVAECDLRKFYDTINHKIIENAFNHFLDQVDKSNCEKKLLRHLFFSYLRCYDYQRSVGELNYDSAYLAGAGERTFHWIDEDLMVETYGAGYKEERIGVPQGGALSGLIANIVLHAIDSKLEQLNDPDLLYLRFCDDMIMLHSDKAKLQNAFMLYQDELRRNKLFIHEPKTLSAYTSGYYDDKSKNPFALGSSARGMIPWITFVGYDISFQGEVRVRKKTIQKQIDKQKDLVSKVLKVVKSSEVPIKREMVIDSVRSRLIGMSVGRISLHGNNTIKQMCWAKGFPCLTRNPYSIRQVKRLDRSRRQQINRIYKSLPFSDEPDKPEDSKKRQTRRKQIIYYGNPYSYHYWLKQKKEENLES